MAATTSDVTATASATSTSTSTETPNQIADKDVIAGKNVSTIVVYDEDDIMSFKESLAAKNTKKSTASSVRRFQSWYQEKHDKYLDMDTISKAEAPYLLKHFFLEIRQTTKGNEGKEYEPGTLQTYRNGLRRYFMERPCPPAADNFDIEEFQEIGNILSIKKKDLKKKGLGNKSNAAEALEDEEVEQMWSSGAIGLHSPRALLNLVWWNNMRHLGMRAVQEHHDCKIEDFIINEHYIQYNERQTKNRQGDEPNRKRKRKYNNKLWRTDGGERDPYRAFIEYKEHRPEGETVPSSFYLSPIDKYKSNVWYKSSPVGVNTLGKIMKNIAGTANLPSDKKFTNSSGRKTAIQSLREDFHPLEISELTGHANPDSISSYSHNPLEKQRNMSHKLSGYSAKSTSNPVLSIEAPPRNALAEIQPLAVSVGDRPVVSTPAVDQYPGLLSGAVNGLFTGVTFKDSPVNISINLQANVDQQRRP